MAKSNILVLLEKIMVYKTFDENDIKKLIDELIFHNPYADIRFKPEKIDYKELTADDIPQEAIVAAQYIPATKTLEISTKFIELILQNGLTIEMLCTLLANIGHELTHVGQFAFLRELVNNPKTTMEIPDEIRDLLEEQETFRLTSNTAAFVNKIAHHLTGQSIGMKGETAQLTINDVLMHGSYFNSALETDARNCGASFARSTLKALSGEAIENGSDELAMQFIIAYSFNVPGQLKIVGDGISPQTAFVALKEIVDDIDIRKLINLEEQFEKNPHSFCNSRDDYSNFIRAIKFCYDVKLNDLNINQLISHSKNPASDDRPIYQNSIHEKMRRLIITRQSKNLPATKFYINEVLEESEKSKTPIISDSLAELAGSVADTKTLSQYLYKTAHFGWKRSFEKIISGFTQTRLNVCQNDVLLSHLLLKDLYDEANKLKAKVDELLEKGNKLAVAQYIAMFYERAKILMHLFDREQLNTRQKEQYDYLQYVIDELSGIVLGPVYAPACDFEELNEFLKHKR